MSAIILDFFEYKFNNKVVVLTEPQCRLLEDLDLELAESLRMDYEDILIEAPNPDFTFDIDE